VVENARAADTGNFGRWYVGAIALDVVGLPLRPARGTAA
jgi:hypothetical protein